MKKTILLLSITLFAVSFQKIDAAQSNPSDCYTWADELASFEGELLQYSYDREYERFIHYYDDCMEYGR